MTPLRLRIDVCTYRGLRDGVPGALDVLRSAGARATFFVAMGPDASGLAILKLLRPSFAMKMLRTRAAASYGLATAFYGTLLPSPLVGAGMPGMLRRIRDEGHEVAAHGWDHRRWQDGMPRFPRERLRSEFGRMAEEYRRALGAPLAAFGSPAWMVTADLLQIEEGAGLRYAADCRGREPFLPVFEGLERGVPQVPITLPTLDERLGAVSPRAFVDEVLALAREQPGYSCFTAHAETEGRAHRDVLAEVLRGIGRPAEPLGELPLVGLPRRAMRMAPIEGRPYPVCRQEEASGTSAHGPSGSPPGARVPPPGRR